MQNVMRFLEQWINEVYVWINQMASHDLIGITIGQTYYLNQSTQHLSDTLVNLEIGVQSKSFITSCLPCQSSILGLAWIYNMYWRQKILAMPSDDVNCLRQDYAWKKMLLLKIVNWCY